MLETDNFVLLKNFNYRKEIKQKGEHLNRLQGLLKSYFVERKYSAPIINVIVDDQFISKNPEYYVYYPYLFQKIFDYEDKKT